MTKPILSLILILTLALSSINNAAFSAESALPKPIDEISEDEIIIKYKRTSHTPGLSSEITNEDSFVEEFANSSGLWDSKQNKKFKKLARHKKKKINRSSNIAVVKLKKKLSKKSLQSLVKNLNRKKFKNANYEIEAIFPNNLYEISEAFAGVTNDPLAYQQLSFRQIQPEKLWTSTKGAGAVVAVIDTGVDYNHEDLKNSIWNNSDEIAGNGIDDDRNGYVDDTRGWDFVDDGGFNCISFEDCSGEDNDPMDRNSHGTHVSGIIAAAGNNSVGISGVAPEAKIMPLKAGYSTGATAYLKTSDIVQAITYAIDNDADVINMSFAGAGLDVLDDILQLANDLGIVLVAAAGNNSSSTPTYPAALPQVIAVGSIADNNTKSSFSNYGEWVDIVAPGSWIMSTIPNNDYGIKSGTSMAAPHVAGIAALIKAKNKIRKINSTEVKSLLLSAVYPTTFYIYPGSAEKVGGLSANIDFGLTVDDITMPSKVLIGENVTITGSGSDHDSTITGYEWNSDVDGYLGSGQSITLSNLSLGAHTISLRVQNAAGQWSDTAHKVLNVSDSRDTNTFNLADNIKLKIAQNKNSIYVKTGPKNRKLIQAYKWVSSNNGTLSTRKALSKNSLSNGYHKVSLLIQDKDGNWSSPIERVVHI